jgi:hypothetical protein
MNPGMSCQRCHPKFTVSGTVFATVREPDNCNGIDGATGVVIVVTGIDGKSITLTPTGSGNFYTTAPVRRPFTAKLVRGKAERLMTKAQSSGDCNSCHTEYGAHFAPGRMVTP